jgi:hypothetical protein
MGKKGQKSVLPSIVLKSGHLEPFFGFMPVQRKLRWETDNFFLQHTAHIIQSCLLKIHVLLE